ncbi:MAG: aldo/keto reductase [Oscillospiraceae bacterium]|nr:aldo/keto reductase [Oscillospiraceae bacterium]
MRKIMLGGVLPVSAVAMGCMRLTDAKEPVDRVIGTALELGVDFFDHADIYGGGRCEEVFGKWLAAHPSVRDGITIQTKCGIRKGCYDFSKKHILESVEGSLKRLYTDHVDVLLLHRPDALMEPEEVAEAFNELEQVGKVRCFGVSNHNPMQIELLKTAVKQPIIADQLQFSLPESGMVTSGLNVNMKNDESVMHDGSVLEYLRVKGITLQAWSPFQGGFFGGPFVGDREKYPALNEKLEETAKKYGVSPTSVAAAWILRHPAKIQLISGSVTPSRMREIAAGADIELSREDWYALYLAAGFRLP